MLHVVLYVWHAAVATMVAQRNAGPAYFAACSLPSASFRARVSPLGSSKSLLSLSDKRRRAFSLFSLFAAVCWHCCIPGGSNYAVTGPVFGLVQQCSHAAKHASLQTSHFSPPPPKNNNNNNIYTPPTTETVHLSRLMRVHYNCCPFHKPASGVTDTF